ncbi:hypothetical protein FA95DRAFT_1564573 [Auriscalpium vulgare]|uniref:Uncharacterized protein n=1 Tax=Auriscalpium vulgare TaxID=40419 RepID=A0ACB8RF05_9AGAM|nr:hypothetical protein FA95DRAFT_1564573 [Auriscalpium vulgare]
MSSLEEFETALKQTVQAKRVSTTKIKALTDIALKHMENDTQLVSILYRTHKALPSSSKVASLYAFDAVARSARSDVKKRGLSGDMATQPGNSATFLLKLDGVLDGLFKDMTSDTIPEGKEKTKKILDIWASANTFPSTVTTRLGNILKGTPASDEIESPDPNSHAEAPAIPTPAPPPPPPMDPAVQSTLMALLAQARSAIPVNGQTPSNNGPLAPTALPDVNLFQALTQVAVGPLNSNLPGPFSPSAPPALPPFGPIPSHSPPPPAQHPPRPSRRSPPRGPWNNERADRPRGPREPYPDDRRDHESRDRNRNGFRGRGRGRWDDRDHNRDNRVRNPGRSQSPASSARRSHSRSPPPRSRYAARRDVKPYSPPRRPSMAEHARGAASSGKDEFGRDVRSADEQVPVGLVAERRRSPSASAPAPEVPAHSRATEQTPSDLPFVASVANGTTAVKPLDTSVGLETFNYATFNFTAPTSWEALGKAWHVSRGYMPSQEELMTFVMSKGMAGGPGPMAVEPVQVQQQQQAGAWNGQVWMSGDTEREGWRGGRGRGRGRGGFSARGARGGFAYGNSRDGQGQWGYGGNDYSTSTDAIVLGGGDVPPMQPANGADHDQGAYGAEQGAGGANQVGASGSMQKVDGKWVFVRTDASS